MGFGRICVSTLVGFYMGMDSVTKYVCLTHRGKMSGDLPELESML